MSHILIIKRVVVIKPNIIIHFVARNVNNLN